MRCFGYLLVWLAFVAFVAVNGSIVVGDKQAHQASEEEQKKKKESQTSSGM